MMKRIAAVCLVLCLCAGGAFAEAALSDVFEAMLVGYQTINQSGDNGIQVQTGPEQMGYMQVDLVSETKTFLRPFAFIESRMNYAEQEHSAQAMDSAVKYAMYLLSQLEKAPDYSEKAMLFDWSQVDKKDLPEGVSFENLKYAADENGAWELALVVVRPGGIGGFVHDEVFAFCRFGMTDSEGEHAVMNALVGDQYAVYNIVLALRDNGGVPEEIEEWIKRHTWTGE